MALPDKHHRKPPAAACCLLRPRLRGHAGGPEQAQREVEGLAGALPPRRQGQARPPAGPRGHPG
eukprot:12637496-Alexandrium_andersonii.AAC.1